MSFASGYAPEKPEFMKKEDELSKRQDGCVCRNVLVGRDPRAGGNKRIADKRASNDFIRQADNSRPLFGEISPGASIEVAGLMRPDCPVLKLLHRYFKRLSSKDGHLLSGWTMIHFSPSNAILLDRLRYCCAFLTACFHLFPNRCPLMINSTASSHKSGSKVWTVG